MAVAPHVAAGLMRLPSVSVPTEKGTVPATVLAVGPAAQELVRSLRLQSKIQS